MSGSSRSACCQSFSCFELFPSFVLSFTGLFVSMAPNMHKAACREAQGLRVVKVSTPYDIWYSKNTSLYKRFAKFWISFWCFQVGVAILAPSMHETKCPGAQGLRVVKGSASYDAGRWENVRFYKIFVDLSEFVFNVFFSLVILAPKINKMSWSSRAMQCQSFSRLWRVPSSRDAQKTQRIRKSQIWVLRETFLTKVLLVFYAF